MKSLKLFFNFLACYCLVFSSTFAQAQDLRANVKVLNNMSTLEYFETNAKTMFQTKEDKRKISLDIFQLRSLTEKWQWRFETNGDVISFRVNGKVQLSAKLVDKNKNIFEVNGKKIHLKKGISYQAALKQFEKLMSSKKASMNSLFFNEAYAIAPLVAGFMGFLIIAGIMSGTSKASAGASCRVQDNPIAGSMSRENFKNRSYCPAKFMSSNYQKRMRQVIPNFNRGGKFDSRDIPNKYSPQCLSNYQNGGLARSQAIQLCKCIKHKQKRCGDNDTPGGWNMLPVMATQTCMVAFNHSCQGAPSVVVVDTPTPTANCGKNGLNCSINPQPQYVDSPSPTASIQKTGGVQVRQVPVTTVPVQNDQYEPEAGSGADR